MVIIITNGQPVIINPKNKKPSKFAIGAIAKIELEDGSKLIRFVDGGNGHSGRNSPEIHFGLGKTNLKNKIYTNQQPIITLKNQYYNDFNTRLQLRFLYTGEKYRTKIQMKTLE